MSKPESGYVNGSDLIMSLGEKCVGHSTSHQFKYSSTTKEHVVKAPASSKVQDAGVWTSPSVTGLGYTINVKSLQTYDETEMTKEEIMRLWKSRQPVEVKAFNRFDQENPYLKGMVIITDITDNQPAGDDVDLDLNLQNYGAPEIFYPDTAGNG